MKTLFFVALFGILHTYLFYPLLMRLLGLVVKEKALPKNNSALPTVEIIFAAFNEETVIHQKLLSSLQTDYPADKLSISIGSDASTDRTDEIIKTLQEKHRQIKLKRFEARSGKATIINELAQQSKAELIIFTDANILFEPETIPRLVNALADKKAGIAGGHILYSKVGEKGISRQENLYLRWENRLKKLESRIFGRAMGVEGGCYIIRTELFPGIPPRYYMEDFYISLAVMKQGHRVLFEERALCYEDVSIHSGEEYRRKVRISIGNFQNLRSYASLLITGFFPTGFIFLSHKVLRWLSPFFLLILLVTCTLLAPSGIFYALFAGIYMMVIGLGLFGILFSQSQKAGILKYPGHFIHMNLALLEGFFIFIKGVNSNVWQPTTRNQE